MKAMNIEPHYEKQTSLYEKVLASKTKDVGSFKNEILSQLEMIAASKHLSLDQLR